MSNIYQKSKRKGEMKMKKWFIILVVVSMMAGGVMPGIASTDQTKDVSASGTVPFSPGPLLDDFRGAGVNLWRIGTGTFKSKPPAQKAEGFCIASYADNPGTTFGRSGYSLKLDYDVSNFVIENTKYYGSFSGYYSKLGGANISSYKYLSFWVKGAAGGEYFKVELKNNVANANRNHAAVYVTDYLDGGVTNDWQKVTIPLDAFANINNWTSIKEMSDADDNKRRFEAIKVCNYI